MIRVRIPPSPTGLLHIGTARTALYNYLFAKHGDADGPGTMIFRIEDTDRERSTREFEENLINGLEKLGIAGDEGIHKGGPHAPYRQSERTDIYRGYLNELLKKDQAYYCFCSKERLDEMRAAQAEQKLPPRYDGCCAELTQEEAEKRMQGGERAVIRLRVPKEEAVTFNDLVRGETCIQCKELDDFVIARAINDPLYHLTVVADDHDMEITHVIRGEDHISNTPKQILIFRAFGWQEPLFAHLPLILNEDKSKLSKRKNKVSVDDYLNDGILPEALLNFLALLGWNTPDEQELFTLEELIEKFTLDRVHKAGAVFDLKKLEWINGEYIKMAIAEDVEAFFERAKPFLPPSAVDKPEQTKAILQDPDFEGRLKKLSELREALSVFFDPLPDYPLDLLCREKFNITPALLKPALTDAREKLDALDWNSEPSTLRKSFEKTLFGIITDKNLKNGQLLWPVRVALSGLEHSPNFSTLMFHLGKEEALRRLDIALNKLV
jgi:glutamyl-tRNA synthetase